MDNIEKSFSELCAISEEEKTYKGAIQWHIPEPEMEYLERYSDGKCIKSDWFSIGSPSYCSFYIKLIPNYQYLELCGSNPPKRMYGGGGIDSFSVSIIFYRKPPECAWVKGKIHCNGIGKHTTFSTSAKDFGLQMEFKDLFPSRLFPSTCGETIHCSMKISMKEIKCAFDKENISYGESRDYDSSKETVKHDTFSDVKISIDYHTFKTHKTVLSHIPYFQELFNANESKQYFELSNIEPEIFNHVVTFLYSRNIPHLHFKLACKLYIVASDLKICDLKCLCSSYLGANLTETNVFIVLKISDEYKDIALKKECLKFIKRADVEPLAEKAIIL